jgi:hypothetical protein
MIYKLIKTIIFNKTTFIICNLLINYTKTLFMEEQSSIMEVVLDLQAFYRILKSVIFNTNSPEKEPLQALFLWRISIHQSMEDLSKSFLNHILQTFTKISLFAALHNPHYVKRS